MSLLVSCLGAWSNHQRRLADPSAAMMIAESVNNTFGRTVSPLNRKLTSGGSSGGESALISFGGSVLGVGTDIGESLLRSFPRVRGSHLGAMEMHNIFRKAVMSTERRFLRESLATKDILHLDGYNG
jgi:hypothetical protein